LEGVFNQETRGYAQSSAYFYCGDMKGRTSGVAEHGDGKKSFDGKLRFERRRIPVMW